MESGGPKKGGDQKGGGGKGGGGSSTPSPTPIQAPASTASPTISGTAQAGQTLTAGAGSWTNSPTSYSYQWQRCDTSGAGCSALAGATSESYAVVAGDVGQTLRVAVTAANDGGSATAVSAPTATVAAAPAAAPPLGTSLPTLLAAPTGQAFYVSPTGSDSGPGTQSAPWATLGKAFATLQAGQVAYVMDGTYGQGSTSSLTWSGSGTQSAPVTVRAYPGDHPVLAQLVKLSGAYLRLSGFTIVRNAYPTDTRFGQGGSTPGGSVGLWVKSCTGCQVDHDEIRGNTQSGLFISSSDGVRVVDNWIHDNGTTRDDHGIYFCSGSGGLLANNVIDHNYDFGIQLYCGSSGPSGTIVTENTVVSNGTPGQGGSGMVLQVSGGYVYDNVVANNVDYGMRGWSGGSAAISSNVVYGNGGGAYYALTSGYTLGSNSLSDPQFVDAAGRDYHLTSGSPARGLALGSYATSSDYEGTSRSASAGPSSGAFQ